MSRILLGKAADVPPGRSKTFVAHGKKVLVSNVKGTFIAYENLCPHMGGAMRYDGERIVCSWHGAQFAPATGISTGNITEGSKLTPLEVVVEGEDLYYVPAQVKSPWADDFN